MTIFLKQYGARRTGTNYLRWLIQSNYSDQDVVPLMHILGDKHSPPPPFDALWREAATAADPAFAFVLKATHSAPADSTDAHNPRQRGEVQRLAASLAESYAKGGLGFLISIKDPYAWMVSVAKFLCWTNGGPLGPHLLGGVSTQCETFNSCYAAWLALAAGNPDRTCIVRHEDLLADPASILGEIESKFALRRSTKELLDLRDEADKVWWDQHKAMATGRRFDRSYYTEKRYLARLSRPLLDAITTKIDWDLIAPLGYTPHDGPS